MKKGTWALMALAMLAVLVLVAVAGCGGGATTTTPATTAAAGETTTTAGTESSSTAGQKITLKYAFFAGEKSFPGVQMLKWKEEVEKRTNGQVTVQIFPSGTLLTAQNMYDGVLSGVADIGLGAATYEPGRFSLISLNDLPGLYSSGVQGSRAIYDVISQNPDIAELKDYYVVTAFATEPARMMTIKRYDTVDSLKGAEIRTAGGPKVVEALGGVEVAMPMSEVQQSLQTGVIKGVLSSREVLKDFKVAEKTKFILEKPLGQVTFLVLMRKDKYEALPANVKKVFDDLRAEMAEFAGQTMDDTGQAAVDWAVATQGNKVVNLSAEENAKFDAAIQPLTGKQIAQVAAKGLPAEDFFKQLQAAAAKYK